MTCGIPSRERPSLRSGTGENEPGTLLSVLCVSGDPIFREQICRNLERDGDIFVEISESSEDAINLMQYLPFQAVVTDSLSLNGEEDGFLRVVRGQGIAIPFICIFRHRVTGIPGEFLCSGRNRFLLWDGQAVSPVFGKSVQLLRELAIPLPKNDCPGAIGRPDLSTGPVV